MMTDPIADMLTRMRNANLALHDTVSMPDSKIKEKIAKLLEDEGFIDSFDVAADGPGKKLTIRLKYTEARSPVIQGLSRVSKPGRRVYAKASELPRSQGGIGVNVISTSQGLLPDREARRRKLGGEILCEVW